MRTELFFNPNTEDKDQYFTRAAEIMRAATRGEVALSEKEKQEFAEYVMNLVEPEIDVLVRCERRSYGLDYYRADDFKGYLFAIVYSDFATFNEAEHLADKSKKYTFGTFLEQEVKKARRALYNGESDLTVNANRNRRYVTLAISKIVNEQEIDEESVTPEMIREEMEDKSISLEMIRTLMDNIKGNVYLGGMEDAENYLPDSKTDFTVEVTEKVDSIAHQKVKEVIDTFTKAELFILMKKFGYLGEKMYQLTDIELCCKDYFVEMVRIDDENEICFGDVKIEHPSRNTKIEDAIIIEKTHYVNAKFVKNRFAKIKRRIAELKGKISYEETFQYLEQCCIEVWNEKFA